ncbi:MAG TPA: DOMON-like domain-containing protein [Caulobacteraceae bacterium]
MALRPHPATPCGAAIAVDAAATRPRPGVLKLTYVVTGDLGALYLPPADQPARADELWKRTCFEAFVRPGAGEAYFEFNFAPTRAWAAYRFDGYRQGMANLDLMPPDIQARTSGERYELTVTLGLPDGPTDQSWRLGLSAVIEAVNGEKSYWALAHPPGKPDFHHPDSFALDLSSAESA